jgi:hypothetical protein
MKPDGSQPRGDKQMKESKAAGTFTLPAKYAPMLFGFILSGLMSFLVSGISTFRAAGHGASVVGLWTGAWLTAWLVAFPVVLVVAPLARKAVQRFVDR